MMASRARRRRLLPTESVESLALALECVHHVHGSDGLAASVFRVGDTVANHILKKDLEHTASFFVNQSRDTLDATTAGETANGGLGDSLDVVAKDFAVALGASLSETFASFTSARHVVGRRFFALFVGQPAFLRFCD